MASLRSDDEVALVDEPIVEPAAAAWGRRLDAKRPLCVDAAQLAHQAAAIIGRDLGLDQIAFWQREYDGYVVLGGFGLNPAARRRRVPATDPAIEGIGASWRRWDATRFDPPRSTWLPGNTAPDLCVLVIDGDGPVDLVTLAGETVPDPAVQAVEGFVAAVDWTV